MSWLVNFWSFLWRTRPPAPGSREKPPGATQTELPAQPLGRDELFLARMPMHRARPGLVGNNSAGLGKGTGT
ncbi:MAG: hypothetical protein FJZ01_22770 [Candidatus Sericytochromatia bacterium]|nr:hypothetical protein [Candidatus Tanganyikabacteria bacterium]